MKLLQIHPADNVAVDTESGFKAALTDIAAGESVIKYGMPIGHATRDIKAGERVHTDNMATSLSEHMEYTFRGAMKIKPLTPCEDTFMGYPRKDGSVGTRNELWIIPTVGYSQGHIADCKGAQTRFIGLRRNSSNVLQQEMQIPPVHEKTIQRVCV